MRYALGTLFVVITLSGCGIDTHELAATISPPQPAANAASVYEFRIKSGTAKGAWNAKDDTLIVKIGDTVKIFNDDEIDHRLHTNGQPCAHGPNMTARTGSYECVISKTFDPAAEGTVYDHNYGTKAEFWLKAVAKGE